MEQMVCVCVCVCVCVFESSTTRVRCFGFLSCFPACGACVSLSASFVRVDVLPRILCGCRDAVLGGVVIWIHTGWRTGPALDLFGVEWGDRVCMDVVY